MAGSVYDRVEPERDVTDALNGFTLARELDLFKYLVINGQMVILETCKILQDCTVSDDPEVGENLPSCFSFGSESGHTMLLGLFENYD